VTDLKKFDCNSIPDDHKKKIHILLSSINKLLDGIQHSYHKNIDAPKSIL
jgi:uncharacterized protein YsxB (DUF464 family)